MDKLNTIGFKSFFTSWYDRCFLFAKSYVHDDWTAENIASEALIELWEIVRTREIETPKTLLFTILKRLALNHLKHEAIKENALTSLSDYGKQELEIRISTLEACEPERIYEADIQNIIQTTLLNLPEQTQLIFKMNRLQDVSKKEIAEKFGITIKGVDYHLYKALKSLRENLKDYYPLALLLLF